LLGLQNLKGYKLICSLLSSFCCDVYGVEI